MSIILLKQYSMKHLLNNSPFLSMPTAGMCKSNLMGFFSRKVNITDSNSLNYFN